MLCVVVMLRCAYGSANAMIVGVVVENRVATSRRLYFWSGFGVFSCASSK